jgi:hypothetical protein
LVAFFSQHGRYNIDAEGTIPHGMPPWRRTRYQQLC